MQYFRRPSFTKNLPGNVCNRKGVYDGYGQDQQPSGTVDPMWGFGAQWGGYTDAETGLTLFTHRYYDWVTGRWLTRDPMGYNGGVNLYGYCDNKPVNEADPDGLYKLPIPLPPPLWPGGRPITGKPVPGPQPTKPFDPFKPTGNPPKPPSLDDPGGAPPVTRPTIHPGGGPGGTTITVGSIPGNGGAIRGKFPTPNGGGIGVECWWKHKGWGVGFGYSNGGADVPPNPSNP